MRILRLQMIDGPLDDSPPDLPQQPFEVSSWKMASGDRPAKERMFAAVWGMKKLDVVAIERAFAGVETVRS